MIGYTPKFHAALTSLLSLSFVFLAACDAPEAPLPVEGSGNAVALLRYVNYPGTTKMVLQVDAGLSERQAEALITYRDGSDGLPVTEDDHPFRSIRELNLVISANTIDGLLSHALERGWMPHRDAFLGYWDQVGFSLSEAELVLDVVNTGTYDELDDDAGLKSNIVDGIMAARPFHSIEKLATVPQMGKVNLGKLKDYALTQQLSEGGQLTQDDVGSL